MPEKLRIRDNVKAIQALRDAGFTYAGYGGYIAGQQESMTLGWVHHPPEDPNNPGSRLKAGRYNVAFLDGLTISLVNEGEPEFPQYHDQIRELLQKRGLIQK